MENRITDAMMKHWRKFDTPRYQNDLRRGRKVIKETIELWMKLRNRHIHPNAIERILVRVLEISPEDPTKVFEEVLEEWYSRRDVDWTFRPISRSFISDVRWFLENMKALGYELKLPLSKKPRKKQAKYPIEEIKRLREEGKSTREIARKLKISKSTIQRILSKI
jgi:hypothetical protein